VIQLGEQPDNVFTVGGLGVDSIKNTPLLSLPDLENALNFKLGTKNLLVTFHPVTLEPDPIEVERQMVEVLEALKELKDTHIIFTMPNADANGRIIKQLIEDFVATQTLAIAFKSLGQLRYLSCVAHMDGVLGNSSSGLLEVPSLKKGTINIGDRQLGRLQAQSIINCRPDRSEISNAIERLYSSEFQSCLKNVVNPYGSGGATKLILEIIKDRATKLLIKKRFYDMHQKAASSFKGG
jgi:GDP/UDP-N,N'-diacetylbacillosamine 2-epimerase (hydrolysing)